MKIIQPTGATFILTDEEKQALHTVAKLFGTLSCTINEDNDILVSSNEYGNEKFTTCELYDIANWCTEIAEAETIVEG